MKKIEQDGFLFEVYDDKVTAKLTREYPSEKVFFSSEVDGIPVRAFDFYPSDVLKKITYVMLPESVSELDLERAFEHNIRFEIDEGNQNYFSDGKALYSKDRSELISFLAYDDEEYTILPGCRKILTYAFGMAKKLKHITFPDGLSSIGEQAFIACTDLEEPELPEGLAEIGKLAFHYCPSIERIVLPSTIEKIGEGAFSLTGLKTLTIPKKVRRLEKNAAGGVKEIHVYDNIENDISEDNEVSDHRYTLYVHSAETDEIKYAVPICINVGKHMMLVGMFRGGASFDFKEFDRYYSEISDILFMKEKFSAGVLRLKYGYDLDMETRREYILQLDQLAKFPAGQTYLSKYNIGELLDPELYRDISMENLLTLIDISVERQLTELAALLMQICNERRAKPDNKD